MAAMRDKLSLQKEKLSRPGRPAVSGDDAFPPVAPPSLIVLLLIFVKISLISFGGGAAALMQQEFVARRRWVSTPDFATATALAQSLPGVNVVNLAIWLGSRLRGRAGAGVALLGVLAPCSVLVIVLGEGFRAVAQLPLGKAGLAGVAAAALGLALAGGVQIARRSMHDRLLAAIFLLTALGAGLLGSVIPLIAVLAPISIFIAWRTMPDE